MAQIIAFPRGDKRRHTVLVVDGQPATSEPLCNHLNDAGFNALAVESADEAARMLDRGIFAIDIVLSDLHVPGILNGYALAQWVSENRPGVPVLLALHDADKINIAEDWAEIIVKPYDSATVVRRIKAMLARRVKRRA
jgi:DNA-binding response OmpR family regulator